MTGGEESPFNLYSPVLNTVVDTGDCLNCAAQPSDKVFVLGTGLKRLLNRQGYTLSVQ